MKGLQDKEKMAYKGRRRLLRTRFIISFIWVGILLTSTAAIAVVGVPQKWNEFFINHNAKAQETSELNQISEQKSEPISKKPTISTNDLVKDDTIKDNNTQKNDAVNSSTKKVIPKVTARFDDCAFIGNSITQSLQLFNLAKGADIFAERGVMVSHFDSKAFIKSPKGKITIKKALEKKQYKKVYIMLGMNEAGWAYESLFVKKYGELVDGIKKSQPDAKIFIQSVLPVSAEKSAKDKIYNNKKVERYNTLLKELAKDKEVTYLDVASAVAGDDGTLPKEASKDGVHLLKPYCQIWVDYLAKNS